MVFIVFGSLRIVRSDQQTEANASTHSKEMNVNIHFFKFDVRCFSGIYNNSKGTPNSNIMIIINFLVVLHLCTLIKMIWVDRYFQSALLSTISMQK